MSANVTAEPVMNTEPQKWARYTLGGTAIRTAMLAFMYANALVSHETDFEQSNAQEGPQFDLDAAWIDTLVMSLPDSAKIPPQHAVFALYLLGVSRCLPPSLGV